MLAVMVVIVAIAAGIVWTNRSTTTSGNPTSKAQVTEVGISPDRKVVWAKVASYYSNSCSRGHPRVDRDGDRATVSVTIEHISDMCTAEACIDSNEGRPLVVPNGGGSVNPACQVYALYLDEPLPSSVSLRAG